LPCLAPSIHPSSHLSHLAPGNTNPYIWAAWGYLEAATGNVARARKLLDAAVVVDDTHAAAWHKWGMLEMRQGNYLRARWVAGGV
jgi:Tfp pilus assembly protein PilF